MKKIILISIAVLLAIAAVVCGVVLIQRKQSNTPFANLTSDNVDYILLSSYTINNYRISDEERDELIGLLNDIVVIEKDDSFKGVDGGPPVVTVYKTNGKSITIGIIDNYSIIYIDGQYYKGETEPLKKAAAFVDEYLQNLYEKRK